MMDDEGFLRLFGVTCQIQHLRINEQCTRRAIYKWRPFSTTYRLCEEHAKPILNDENMRDKLVKI